MKLTAKAVAFVAHLEGLVPQAYKDSVGVWTWALGVTNASGHQVYPRYLDKPQPLEKCVEVSIWLLEQRYLPAVADAFDGHALEEHQLAAALSFHWNTGAIERADWVKEWLAGDKAEARIDFMNYRKPPEIIPRREKERKLFFEAVWPEKMLCPVRGVDSNHHPKGTKAVDLLPIIEQVMGGS